MVQFSRRQFLALTSTFFTSPAWSNAPSSEPEVIVIGAGAAGIAAARKFIENGIHVVVLEAGDRIGGRIFTDTTTFGTPFDMGAHWLHNGEENPFVQYGMKNGFTLYKAPENELLFVNGKLATDAEFVSYQEATDATLAAIEEAGVAGRDVSAASVAPDLGLWTATARFQIGPYEMGKDLSDFSCADWYSGSGGTDWFCKQGFGSLWLRSARGIPVQLNTEAKVIRWDGKGVVVETNLGDLRAKACVVTVSTGVLAANGIRFVPELPAEHREAFSAISMGFFNHVALQFTDNIFDAEDDTFLTYQIDDKAAGAVGLLTNASGSSLTIADFGGSFAWEMEAAGERAAVDYALSELRRIFGSEVDRSFRKAKMTGWGNNPLTRGAYASAQPGASHLRSVLREPVGERIWFAGEACSETEWATVSGAHKNGIEVADQTMGALKRK